MRTLPMSEAQQKLTAAANAYRAAEINASSALSDHWKHDTNESLAVFHRAADEAGAAWSALTEAIQRYVP